MVSISNVEVLGTLLHIVCITF